MSEYPALKVSQRPGAESIILLGARCSDIVRWAGIPRKQDNEGVQTVGYQRAEDSKRIAKISDFLGTNDNVIPNPILIAVRDRSRISFQATEPSRGDQDAVQIGRIVIEEDVEHHSLTELLERSVELLEVRLPSLKQNEISESDVTDFLQSLPEASDLLQSDDVIEDDSVATAETDIFVEDSDQSVSFETGVSFSTESHIHDFHRALKIRLRALQRANSSDREELGGISKELLNDYLKPAVVVDGQHRLLGAVKRLSSAKKNNSEIMKMLRNGIPQEEAEKQLNEQHAPVLTIALIDNPDWAEHVFQFVVVNQKATPIPRALLASIVATTLSDEEISRIRDRLKSSGIPVEDYITINFLNSSEASPFRGMIKRGYGETNSQMKLDMTVVDRLVTMFRELKGGQSFENKPQDYAALWKSARLDKFKFLDDYQTYGFDRPFDYWRSPEGPWRDFFCRFWSTVKRICASDTDDLSAGNAWGYPKSSNLFNGIHLQILAADFFQFLYARAPELNSIDEVEALVEEQWLEFVAGKAKEYFARDWRLQGLKKTDGSVKQKWTEVWKKFRNDPSGRLPQVSQYRP